MGNAKFEITTNVFIKSANNTYLSIKIRNTQVETRGNTY